MSESERLCSKLLNRLKDIGSAAIALSGGVDSCFLAYAASRVEGGNFAAYYVQSAFQPEFELTDALRAAKEAELPFKIISVDILACEDVVRNPTDRCYHSKKHIFSAICRAAAADGYKTILDGTNASDAEDDRPGMRALREAGVLSPLRECGLTSGEIGEYFDFRRPMFAVNKTVEESKRYREDYLQRMIKKGLCYDADIKNGRIDGWTAAELYLAELLKRPD